MKAKFKSNRYSQSIAAFCLSISFLIGCTPTEPALIDPAPPIDPAPHSVAPHSVNETEIVELPDHLTTKTQNPAAAKPTITIQTRRSPRIPVAAVPLAAAVAAAVQSAPPARSLSNSPKAHAVQATPFGVKRCMNMGNALEAPNEGDWGYRIRAQDFRTVARAGFDTVRIPISWSTHAQKRPPFLIDPVFMARVKTLVAQAQANDLGVILDIHHYDKLMARPKRHRDRYLSLWQQISTAFANTPDSVYFELLNEPKEALKPAAMNALYLDALSIIRRTNPTRKVIIGGYPWNFIEGMDTVNWAALAEDKNLVATFHFYDPHPFTHQGAQWERPVQPTGIHWGSVQERRDVYTGLKWAKDFQTRTGLPIFVGEFGVIDQANQAERNTWMRAHRKAMEEYGFSWCAWDYAGAFKSFDIDNERWFDGVVRALIGP